MAGDCTSGSHLIGIHVVVFAIRAKRDRRQHRNSALSPNCFQPARSRPNRFRQRIPGHNPASVSCARGTTSRRRRKDQPPDIRRHSIAATRLLFTMPARTIRRDVARFGIGNSQPIDEIALLAQQASACASARLPPPCTTVTRCPSCASSTMARAHFCSVDFSSSAAPPILTRSSLQAFFFFPSVHQIHVLNRLAGRAFEQIIDARNQNQPPPIVREAETQIAIIGVQGKLDLRQIRSGKNAYPRLAGVKITKAGFHFARL